jgi:O-antigen/teichoic acid export membrane protein
MQSVRRQTMLTALGTGASQLLPVISGPLVARMLGVEDRGHLALLALIPSGLAQLGTMGLPLAATYEIVRAPAHAETIVRRLVGPAVLQTCATAIAQAAVLIILLSGARGYVVAAAAITLLAVPGSIAQRYGLAVMQGNQRFGLFNVFRVVPMAFYAVIVAGMFGAGVTDLRLVTCAWVAALVVGGGATLLAAGRSLPLDPEGRLAGEEPASTRDMLKFGMRGLLGSISPVDGLHLDQAAVALFLSPAALGLYVVGLAFANLPRLVGQSIGIVAYPRVAQEHSLPARRRMVWRFAWVGAAASALMILGLELSVGRLIPFFFGDAFTDAVPATRILLLGALFLSVRRILSDGARGAGRPGLGTVAEVVSFGFFIAAAAALAPSYGLEGVAIALTASAVVSCATIVLGLMRREET